MSAYTILYRQKMPHKLHVCDCMLAYASMQPLPLPGHVTASKTLANNT